MDSVSAKQDQLNAILSSMAEGLIAVDTSRRVIIMNQAAGILLRLSPAEAQGQNLNEILFLQKDGRDLRVEESPYERAMIDKNIITLTLLDKISLKNRHGQIYPVSLMAAPLLLQGEVTGGILLFRDITKERDVDRTKTEFVSLASHQLKTPLSAISWYAEAMLNEEVGGLNEKQKQYLQNLYDSNRRMVGLVNSLLNVSRLELGTFLVEPEPTNVLELAESVLAELAPALIAKKIKLEKVFATDVPVMNLDPKLARMIFQNLLSNAIKYTPAGGQVTLAINLADEFLLIRVGDSGYGIPTNDQKKIFSKLFRADNIREVEAEGTGLGLYIVKSIVEQAGGRVWFDSLESKGTTFYVTLPLSGMVKKTGSRALS
ncbi:MAG: ATP-binding protein [Patescibacteria group bacterium]